MAGSFAHFLHRSNAAFSQPAEKMGGGESEKSTGLSRNFFKSFLNINDSNNKPNNNNSSSNNNIELNNNNNNEIKENDRIRESVIKSDNQDHHFDANANNASTAIEGRPASVVAEDSSILL